jgi:hypothetical protein
VRSMLFAVCKLKGSYEMIGTGLATVSLTNFFDVRRIEQFCEKVHALGRYRIQD